MSRLITFVRSCWSDWSGLDVVTRRIVLGLALFLLFLIGLAWHNRVIRADQKALDDANAATATALQEADQARAEFQKLVDSTSKQNAALDRRTTQVQQSSAAAMSASEQYVLQQQALLDRQQERQEQGTPAAASDSGSAIPALPPVGMPLDTTGLRVVTDLRTQLAQCTALVADDSTQRAKQQAVIRFALDTVVTRDTAAQAALQRENNALNDQLHPHGLAAVWATVEKPLVFAGGITVGILAAKAAK